MTTTDTVILAREASTVCRGGLAFDLGTGAGDVPRLVSEVNRSLLWIGIDNCHKSLRLSRDVVLPVLAGVDQVPALFPAAIADLVTANPPFFVNGSGRPSPDPARECERRGAPLLIYMFVFAAAHLLKPGGVFLLTFRWGEGRDVETAARASGIRQGRIVRRGRTGLLSGLGRPA